MNRHDVRQIQQIEGYPCVTITLPTHRTSPQNKQDPIRVKNLVRQAGDRLLEEFGKREIASLMNNLEKLTESIDYRYLLDGLVLFVNRDFARAFQLPFSPKERVVVDENFFTRELVFALNRTARYWALVLSEKPTRLFEGVGEHLTEIDDGGFPMTHQGPGGERPLPGGIGIEKTTYRDERHRQFFRQVDESLKFFMADDPLPLIVVGVERYLSFFNEISEYRDHVVGTLEGSHDKTSSHDLSKLVWPLVQEDLSRKRQEVFSLMEKAMGERKVASAPGDVWRAAQEGRGRILLVEEDFHYPARLDETSGGIIPAEDVNAPDVMDDAVDEIIETVLDKQGRVVFVDNGQLKDHHGIALILRY